MDHAYVAFGLCSWHYNIKIFFYYRSLKGLLGQ